MLFLKLKQTIPGTAKAALAAMEKFAEFNCFLRAYRYDSAEGEGLGRGYQVLIPAGRRVADLAAQLKLHAAHSEWVLVDLDMAGYSTTVAENPA